MLNNDLTICNNNNIYNAVGNIIMYNNIYRKVVKVC